MEWPGEEEGERGGGDPVRVLVRVRAWLTDQWMTSIDGGGMDRLTMCLAASWVGN